MWNRNDETIFNERAETATQMERKRGNAIAQNQTNTQIHRNATSPPRGYSLSVLLKGNAMAIRRARERKREQAAA